MRPELRDRREETWDLLVVKGLKYSTVCERLAAKYDVKENTIEKDISRMKNWLPELIRVDDTGGYSRLREIRQNRQRMQQMAMEARRDGDRKEELRIRRLIDQAVELDITISQSLGMTQRAPDEVSVTGDMSHDHDHDHDHEHKHAHAEVGQGLTEKQRKHLDAITGGAEEIEVEAVSDSGSAAGDDDS